MNATKTKTETAHGALADSTIHRRWIDAYRTPEALQFYEVAFDEIVKTLDAPHGATILDAGCGSCAKSVLLASRGFNVVGADFSAHALALGEEVVRERGLQDRITLRQADLCQLPFETGEFKYVLCWGVLMHVPALRAALGELARVLAPGGALILSEGNMRSAQAVAIRTLKKVLRKGRGKVVRVPAGLETHEQTPQGELLTRQTDMTWLEAECTRLGLRLSERRAGQLTELYVSAPTAAMRRAIHWVNRLWFRYVRAAGPAYGNILIFVKQAGTPDK